VISYRQLATAQAHVHGAAGRAELHRLVSRLAADRRLGTDIKTWATGRSCSRWPNPEPELDPVAALEHAAVVATV
jgi:hypothetical protein